ncbi:uncharacterized protein PG986_006777 [Apiospora aurea]|uniref:Amine oxidase domain-containing protein n=1 Tax=Apiospora aurea TaxID=335848 RepID=A0ABR1QAR6_9PEZI
MADQSQVPEPAPIQELSHRSQWASFAMRKRPDPKKEEILPAEETRYPKDTDGTLEKKLRVGIIGAGVSGLFTAMTFDYLKQKYGLDIEYEILEANGEERLGGRLFTYYFKNKIDNEGEVVPPPKTFKLFKELGMEFNDQDIKKNRETNPPKPGQLVPYHLNGKNQPMLCNSVQVITDGVKVPTAKAFNITGLPIDVRQYLTQIASYDYNTIEYLETMNFGNRWYDQAFSEAVLESLDFDATARWWCVEGGSKQIADCMRDRLRHKEAIEYNKRVLAMTYVDKDHQQIDVTVQGEEDKPRRFDAVFNSAPLGTMQQMGLEGLKLNWGTKQAIRSLGYGASCKIGVRFRSLWWIHKLWHQRRGPGQEGPAHPLLRIPVLQYVRPSRASRRAARLLHVVAGGRTNWRPHQPRVARQGGGTEACGSARPGTAALVDRRGAYNWYADPTSVGAFAFFGPGQFQKMYPSIVQSHGKHVIIGEAASSHHAWVVGALESAVRGVYQFLWQHSRVSEAAHRAAEDYAADRVSQPFGPVPAEYDRTQDIRVPDGVDDAALPSPKGELARQQAMVEEIRLKQGGDFLDPSIVSERDVAPILAVVSA